MALTTPAAPIVAGRPPTVARVERPDTVTSRRWWCRKYAGIAASGKVTLNYIEGDAQLGDGGKRIFPTVHGIWAVTYCLLAVDEFTGKIVVDGSSGSYLEPSGFLSGHFEPVADDSFNGTVMHTSGLVAAGPHHGIGCTVFGSPEPLGDGSDPFAEEIVVSAEIADVQGVLLIETPEPVFTCE